MNCSVRNLKNTASYAISSVPETMRQSRIRFDAFELNLHTGELHKDGRPIRLQDQPAKLLTLLATRPGEVVTRDEIQQQLWNDGEFVEFEHAVNTAIRKIRVALDDDADRPRIIQTLPRKGYRFIAPVEGESLQTKPIADGQGEFVLPVSVNSSRLLFFLAQVPYIAIYLAVFYYWYNLDSALASTFGFVPVEFSRPFLQMLALIGFTIRVYLICLVGWGHSDAGPRYRKLFPYLLPLDAVYAATPLLAQQWAGPLVSWAGLILMGWLIFGQRSLMKRIEQGR